MIHSINSGQKLAQPQIPPKKKNRSREGVAEKSEVFERRRGWLSYRGFCSKMFRPKAGKDFNQKTPPKIQICVYF